MAIECFWRLWCFCVQCVNILCIFGACTFNFYWTMNVYVTQWSNSVKCDWHPLCQMPTTANTLLCLALYCNWLEMTMAKTMDTEWLVKKKKTWQSVWSFSRACRSYVLCCILRKKSKSIFVYAFTKLLPIFAFLATKILDTSFAIKHKQVTVI